MPSIIGQAEQKQAMKDIVAGLKELASINRFLNNECADNTYTITFLNPAGEKVSAVGSSESKDPIDLLILNKRDMIISAITKLAQDYHIEFDEKDLLILENRPAPEPAITIPDIKPITDISE